MVNIDSQQHKVTVTGNINAETLVKKLIKEGKQAELWPEPEPNPEPNSSGGSKKSKNKKKKKKNNNNDNQPNPINDPSNNQKKKEPQHEEEEEEDGPAPTKDNKAINPGGGNGNGDGGGGEAAVSQNHQRPPGSYNPPMYPMPPPVVSYRTVQPVMAETYYIPAMATAREAGRYDYFSEENANACSVM